MKTSENFKRVILQELQNIANEDQQFAASFTNPNKNIDDCITYILNQVKKSGLNGFEDREIFGMALHYYDEEIIEIGTQIQCQIITNHQVKLTDQEVAEAKQKAIESIIHDEKTRLKSKSVSKTNSNSQPSLF